MWRACADFVIPKSFCVYTVNSLRTEKSFRNNVLEVAFGKAGARCRVTPARGAAGPPVNAPPPEQSPPSVPLNDLFYTERTRAFTCTGTGLSR